MRRRPTAKAAAIGRSLDVYYRDDARTRAMDRLNAEFIPNGGLAFDIGAHVGDRTASFLRLGASVIALEPQPAVFRALRLIHGRSAGAHLRQEAVGAAPGGLELFVNSANPTVSTGSQDLITAAQRADGWQGQNWDQKITVPVTTLDHLIADHGTPDFMKIDVEGYEAEVLKGLNTAVAALSFEFTTIQREIVNTCIHRLEMLGQYEFNLSMGEDHVLKHRNWVSAENIQSEVERLPVDANSGDIYARLV